MVVKKIPRAIKVDLLKQLKEIDPDINKAIKSALSDNSRSKPVESLSRDELIELSNKLWPFFKKKVEAVVDIEIEEARRGY